ncbi:MAG: ABC transporter substrate-binding protein [Acidimicrobiales bacterium]
MRWRGLLTILLAVSLMAAACGGDSDEPADDGGSASGGDDTASGGETSADDGPAGSDDAQSASGGDDTAGTECPVDALDDAEGSVEITLWHSMSGSNEEAINSLAAAYNASQDRVRVETAFQGTYDENREKYIGTVRGGGDKPEVIQLSEVSAQIMVDSRSIVAVQDCVDASGYDLGGFLPGLVDQFRIEGVLWSLPFQLSNPVVYYDRNDFVAAGLDPDDFPETFAEFLDAARTLVASGAVETAIALDIDSWLIEQWIAKSGTPVVDNGNGRDGRATQANLDTPIAAEIFDLYATLTREGLLDNTGRSTDDALDKYLAVAFGTAAMTIGTSASLGQIYTQLGAFPDIEIGVAPLPGPTNGGITAGGGSLYLVEDTDPAERAAVWDFMTWLNEPDQQVEWSNLTGYIPTQVAAQDDPELAALWSERPGYRVAFDQLASQGPDALGFPVMGDYPGFREAVEQALEDLVEGLDPAEALARAQSEATEAIEAYNERIGG